MANKFKIRTTGPGGMQVEWRGILLTLQQNKFHGLSGSIAEQVDGKTKLLSFHGKHPEQYFPLTFHEEELET